MKYVKRLLCLLLILPMLLISSFAESSSGEGGTGQSHLSGAGKEHASYFHTGLALGIQLMDGENYKVYPEDQKPDDWCDAVINNKGLAKVCEHFLRSYPDPDGGDEFYLLPNVTYEPDYRTTTVDGFGQVQIAGRYACWNTYTASPDQGHALADKIYTAIQNDQATYAYFQGLINDVDYATALSYIGYIFGQSKVENGIHTVNVSAVNNNWSTAYNKDATLDMETSDQSKRKIANYTAILTCLAKLLSTPNSATLANHKDSNGNTLPTVTEVWSANNQNKYSRYIADFATAALNGEAYSPIVITAEVCEAFRHNYNNQYDTWRTTVEHLALCANRPESDFRKADSGVLKISGLGDGDINMAQTMLKAARKQSNNTGSLFGGGSFLGLKADGSLYEKYGYYGRVMTSLSDSVVNCLRSDNIPSDWGISVPGDASTEALWGCGIFGGTEALTVAPQHKEDPQWKATTSATVDITAGEISPSPVTQGVQQTAKIDVTVTLNLSAELQTREVVDGVPGDWEKKDGGYSEYIRLYQQDNGYDVGSLQQLINGDVDKSPVTRLWLKVATVTSAEEGKLEKVNEVLAELEKDAQKDQNDEGALAAAALDKLDFQYVKEQAVDVKQVLDQYMSKDSNGIWVDVANSKGAYDDWGGGQFDPALATLGSLGECISVDRPTGNWTITIETTVEVPFTLNSNEEKFYVAVVTGGNNQYSYPMYDTEECDKVTGSLTGRTSLKCIHKAVFAYWEAEYIAPPEEYEISFSTLPAAAYAEFKQGTPLKETFNSMSGTPTVTLADPENEESGTYYQYFASGGTEFVVQFDAEWVYDQTAERTYTINFNPAYCSLNGTHNHEYQCRYKDREGWKEGKHPCTGGHTCNGANCSEQWVPTGKGTGYYKPYCPGNHKCSENNVSGDGWCQKCPGRCCACDARTSTLHDTINKQHTHTLAAAPFTFTVNYTGLSYMQITNVHVWQLAEAKLESTAKDPEIYLLDTNTVTATVANVPSISYNIAQANTAAQGRVVYEYDAAQNDHVVITHALDKTCNTEAEQANKFVAEDLAKITLGAWCVSDYLILHTTNGDQAIFYYEYKSEDWGKTAAAAQISATYTKPTLPDDGPATTTASISSQVNTCTVKFEKKRPHDEMFVDNPSTFTYDTESTAKLTSSSMSYAGYNGNWSDTTGKYTTPSYCFGKNIEWTQTVAYQNFNHWSSGTGKRYQATYTNGGVKGTEFLVAEKLAIPDNRINGEYNTGTSSIYYKKILTYGNEPITINLPSIDSDGGFWMTTTYSPDHNKINDVVVFDPVSAKYAVVVSLPDEMDQRVPSKETGEIHKVAKVELTATCPGDSTCAYQQLTCTRTDHLHTEDCYYVTSQTIHSGNNIHVCTDACANGCTYELNAHDCNTRTPGTTTTYTYSGEWETVTLPAGTYKLEAWGAQGAQYTGEPGLGGYSAGTIILTETTTLYIGVGGQGEGTAGGYNGGGQGAGVGYGGGGATNIFLASDVEVYTGRDVSGNTGVTPTYNGNSATFSSTSNANIYNGGNKARKVGEYYKVEWHGSGLSNSRITYDGGYYSAAGSTFSPGGGVQIVGQRITDTCAEIYYYITADSYVTEFRMETGGATVTIDEKIITKLNNPILVAGGGGGSQAKYGGDGGGANQSGTMCTVGYGSNAGAGTLSSGYAMGIGGPALQGSDGYYGGAGGGGYWGGYGSKTDVSYVDDKGGSGGSGYANKTLLTDISGTTGTNSGDGRVCITSMNTTTSCYTKYSANLTCSDPHHAYSYNWKLYTYGLQHTSGHICDGRTCTDTTPIVFPNKSTYTVAQCAAGSIVRHSNGTVHLTTKKDGTCTYCNSKYSSVLSTAQSTDRTPANDEWSHYAYGNARCYSACNNNENHRSYVTSFEAADNNGNITSYEMGEFICLDYPFQIYFSSVGDFKTTNSKYANSTTGAAASSETTSELGKGYTNGMDTDPWIKSKWVQFPFAVVFEGKTYLAYERIELDPHTKVFDFYLPIHVNEVANAQVQFGVIAINNPQGDALDCRTNADQNNSPIFESASGQKYCRNHSAHKLTYIDVVGSIGNMTLEDTGDFRYSNLFKQQVDEWFVKNIVRRVDITKPYAVLMDTEDIHGNTVKHSDGSTTVSGVTGDTYGTKTERNGNVLSLPLTPSKNNITALQKQPVRVGYNHYFDFMTIGNYYGNTLYDDDGNKTGQNLCTVKPHYYRLDLDTGKYAAVDVYMDVNGNKVLINDADADIPTYDNLTAVSLNWVDEAARRNYSGLEVTYTNAVNNAFSWVEIPSGTSWIYGNYDLLNLTARNRTFVGSEHTYAFYESDPSKRLWDTQAYLQGQRWHFSIGLPSSAVFVYSGQAATQANIDACSSGNAVIVCALEVWAQGEIWTLAYDGSSINQPFTVVPGGRTYDVHIPYPGNTGKEMPIVSIISINHSSKEDLSVAGTQ